MELNMLHRAQTFHQSYKGKEFHFHQTIFFLRVWKNTLRARLEMYRVYTAQQLSHAEFPYTPLQA